MFKKFRINFDCKPHKKGDILKLKVVPGEDCPLDSFWSRRWRDAKIDNCIELVPDEKSVTQEKSGETDNSSKKRKGN